MTLIGLSTKPAQGPVMCKYIQVVGNRIPMNYFNTNITQNHEFIMYLNCEWVKFLNFLLTLNLYDEDMLKDEILETRCYDV